MDPIQAARRFLQRLQERGALDDVVAPDCDVQGLLDTFGGEERTMHIVDLVMKRNLVFASVAWMASDGTDEAGMTWALSFDREGRLLSWQALT